MKLSSRKVRQSYSVSAYHSRDSGMVVCLKPEGLSHASGQGRSAKI